MSKKDFRVMVPQNLDDVFSIDNFKFSQVKDHIKYLFEVLQKMGIRMEDLDHRFTSKISLVNELQKAVKAQEEKLETQDVKFEVMRNEVKEN